MISASYIDDMAVCAIGVDGDHGIKLSYHVVFKDGGVDYAAALNRIKSKAISLWLSAGKPASVVFHVGPFIKIETIDN